MTGAAFLAAIEALGMTRDNFAKHLCLDRSTVYRWTEGARAVPPWIPPVLALLNKEYER
jgi:transcriptional regulator with XRE-family HTH domain